MRVIHFFIGDEPDDSPTIARVRAVVTKLPDEEMSAILLDSGADAAAFPARFAETGVGSDAAVTKLHDAQGRCIPVLGMHDIEVHLTDQGGQMIVIKEHVAISDQIQQPILCFGKLLEAGWGVCSREQVLMHPEAGVMVPIELQNRSMTVIGWIRAVGEQKEESVADVSHGICAVKARVREELQHGPIGSNLDENGCGVGRHFAECFQDPTLAVPGMSGPKYRTTLVKDQGSWLVMELCGHIGSIIDLGAGFHELHGPRDVLTVVTDGEKDPRLMGFYFEDDDSEAAQPAQGSAGVDDESAEGMMAPEDELQGVEIPPARAELPVGAYVIQPFDDDKLVVNGVELTRVSKLTDMRAACTRYNLSNSGGKDKCYIRLVAHMKQLELELIDAAAHRMDANLQRDPQSPPLAVEPDDKEVEKHNLTHTPYAPWCPSCVCFRARADKQIRNDQVKASSIPCISFDFAQVSCWIRG